MIKNTKAERLAIYKRALKIVSGDKVVFGHAQNYICWILVCLQYKVESVHSKNLPFGTLDPYWAGTKIFPEFRKYYDKDVRFFDALLYNELFQKDKDKWRVKVLKEIIKKMESK